MPQTPSMKWIQHLKLCRSVDSYEVTSVHTEEHCKKACARDNKCSTVMYDSERKKCWKSSSPNMYHSRKCPSTYNFYQKGISSSILIRDWSHWSFSFIICNVHYLYPNLFRSSFPHTILYSFVSTFSVPLKVELNFY